MRLREAERFSDAVVRLVIVDSKRFWIAPSAPRRLPIDVSAASTRRIAVLALATVVTLASDSEPLVAVTLGVAKPRLLLPVPERVPPIVTAWPEAKAIRPVVLSNDAKAPWALALIASASAWPVA